jgi:hypothetical protein
VDAATPRAVARCDRKAVTSRSPISRGCRPRWNRTNRRIQLVYASAVRGLACRRCNRSRTTSSNRRAGVATPQQCRPVKASASLFQRPAAQFVV